MRSDSQDLLKKCYTQTPARHQRWIVAHETAIGVAFDGVLSFRKRDVGQLVRGARKERGMLQDMLTSVGLRALEGMSASEAAVATVKARIWPKLSVSGLRERGYTSGAAFIAYHAHKLIAVKPFEDSAAGRQMYVDALEGFRDFLYMPDSEQIRVDDFKACLSQSIVLPAQGRVYLCTGDRRMAENIAFNKHLKGELDMAWASYATQWFIKSADVDTKFAALGERCIQFMGRGIVSQPPGMQKLWHTADRLEETGSWAWADELEPKAKGEANTSTATTLASLIGEAYSVEAMQARGFEPGPAYYAKYVWSGVRDHAPEDPTEEEFYIQLVTDMAAIMEATKTDLHAMLDLLRAKTWHLVRPIRKATKDELHAIHMERNAIGEKAVAEAYHLKHPEWHNLKGDRVKQTYRDAYWEASKALHKQLAQRVSGEIHAQCDDLGYDFWIAVRELGSDAHARTALRARILEVLGSDSSSKIAGKASGAALKRAEDMTWQLLGSKRGGSSVVIARPTAVAAGVSGNRIGGPEIHPPYSADSITRTFGLTTIDYGVWVNSAEGDSAEKAAMGALTDLADVMGVPAPAVGLGIRIGLGIGSRGRGGRAAAHYELGSKMINMTKTSGAGSLAHEWGHALDHWLGDRSKTGGAALTALSDYADQPGARAGIDSDGAPIAQAMAHLLHVMEGDDYLGEWKELEKRETAAEKRYRLGLSSREDWHAVVAQCNARKRELSALSRQKGGRSSATRYKSDAAKLDKGKSKAYWSTPVEMFARAWESWVQAKLEAEGRESTYLVSDTGESKGSGPHPYPCGVDRVNIFEAIEDLVRVIRPALVSVSQTRRENPRRKRR